MSRNSSLNDAWARRRAARWGRRVVALLALGAVLALSAGCGSSNGGGSTSGDSTVANSSGSKPFTIGLMVLSLRIPFFVDQVRQARALVEQAGGRLVVLDPDLNPTKQLQGAQNWLNANQVDAILGSVADVNAFQPALDQAAKQKVPVVLLGYQPRHLQAGQTVILQSPSEWGALRGAGLARCINERLGGKAEVVMLTGPNIPGPTVNDNLGANEDVVKRDAPGAEFVAHVPGDALALKSRQAIQTVLQAHPGVNAVAAIGDESLLAALDALKDAGKDPRDICIAGNGDQREGLAAFHAGEFYSDIDLNLPKIYRTAVGAAVALIRDENDPRYSGRVVTFTPFTLLYK